VKKVAALASLPLSKYNYNVTNEQFLPKILHRMILGLCNREEHDVDIKDELITSEKWTKQVMVPMKTLQPMQPMKTLQTSSRRRLDWSNISASEIFDCGGNVKARRRRIKQVIRNVLPMEIHWLLFHRQARLRCGYP
jgi:hypothetical protein